MCHLRGCECGTSSAPPRCEIRLCISIFQADVQDKAAAKTNIPAKSWKNQFFNTFSSKNFTGKKQSPNQDPAKSYKKTIYYYFSRSNFNNKKHSHQNQDPAKSWKNQLFNTFSSKILTILGNMNVEHHPHPQDRIYLCVYRYFSLVCAILGGVNVEHHPHPQDMKYVCV